MSYATKIVNCYGIDFKVEGEHQFDIDTNSYNYGKDRYDGFKAHEIYIISKDGEEICMTDLLQDNLVESIEEMCYGIEQ